MSAPGIDRQLLSPAFAGRGIEWIRVTLPPGAATDDLQPYHPAIDKYVLVEAGSLRMVVGATAHLLEVGDAFYFRADVIHRFENAGMPPASTWPCWTGRAARIARSGPGFLVTPTTLRTFCR